MTPIQVLIFTCHLINLELMKLSSYYKGRREIVSLSPSFLPDKYTNFIYRKDYYDGKFPQELWKNGNIEYGGRAFNELEYVPLPEDIEQQKSDIYLYEKTRPQFATTSRFTEAFNAMCRAEHFRLSLDGKTVWSNFEKQINITKNTRTLFLHDYNLNNVENSDIILKELQKEMFGGFYSRNLAVKFPIQVQTSEDLFKWSSFNTSYDFFILEYDGVMDDEVFQELLEKRKTGNFLKQTQYLVTKKQLDEKTFIEQKLPKVFKQVIYAKSNGIQLTIKYDNYFFTNKYWEELLELFNFYLYAASNQNNNKNKEYKTIIQKGSFFDFMKYYISQRYAKSTIKKSHVPKIFQFVRENNYDLFKDFYECKSVKLKGGVFENE